MIDEEITHWYKDEKGELHRTCIRLESAPPQLVKGYPKDGLITIRLTNTVGAIGFKLNPAEALQLSMSLINLAREQMQSKRSLWQAFEE